MALGSWLNFCIFFGIKGPYGNGSSTVDRRLHSRRVVLGLDLSKEFALSDAVVGGSARSVQGFGSQVSSSRFRGSDFGRILGVKSPSNYVYM